MKTLFDPAVHAEFVDRLNRLSATSARVWGKMTPAQMLSHVNITLEMTLGDRPVTRGLMARILGPLFRGSLLSPKPFSRNSPTGPELIVADARDLETERRRALDLLGRFVRGGPAAADGRVHGFIGTLSGEEWGRMHWKHLDHHLSQFGV